MREDLHQLVGGSYGEDYSHFHPEDRQRSRHVGMDPHEATFYKSQASATNVVMDGSISIVLINASINLSVTLPDPTRFPGRRFGIKRTDTNPPDTVTVTSPSGSIDGNPNFVLMQGLDYSWFYSDGTDYWII